MRRIGLIALMCCSLLVPLNSTAGAAAFQAGAITLDVPAIVPNVEDLQDAGFVGYSLTSTGMFTQADDAAFVAGLLGVDEEDVDAMFTDAGRESSYLGTLTLLQDPGDPESAIDRELQITVYAFADEAGAADAYDFLTDEGNDSSFEDVEGTTQIGDASELTRRTGGEGVVPGVPVQELELQFRSGRLLVFASLYVYGEDAPEADVADAEAIGEVLAERAAAVLDGDAPGLSPLVPVFPEVEGSVPYVAYWLRDGEAVPFNREIPDDTDARIETYGDATDFLSFQQQIIFGDETEDDDFLFNNNLLKFPSADDAAEFVENTEDRIRNGINFIDIETVDDAPELGDASVTVLRTSILNDQEWTRYQINVAVGDIVMVAWVAQVVPDIMVGAEPLYELAEAQTQCLEDGECAGTIDIPAGITEEATPPADDSGDSGSSDDAVNGDRPDIGIGRQDDDATPEADDNPPRGDEATYESPQYGYALTYNMQEWEVFADDPDPDDAYDRITLSSTTGIEGVITVIGDPDYAPDAMGDCVADYAAGLEQSDGVSNVDEMRGEDGEEENRAWAAYSYVLEGDDGEVDAVRYVECISFDDITIVVLQSSVDTDYADLSDARVILLEGLDA